MSYGSFAAVYDRLMSDCDYSARAGYLLGLFNMFGVKPKLMLDLACGTGNMSLQMLSRGVDVIAVDISEEMLNVAKTKAADANYELLCLCQNAAELDLYGTVDSAVCCLDSVNHITEYDDICSMFKRLRLFIEPGGLFIFDANSEYKHSDVLGDNVFVIDDEDVYCVWQNSTEMPYTDICLDFFVKHGDTYSKSTEEFTERAYSDSELISASSEAGFEILAVYSDMTTAAPSSDCERKIFIMRNR